ncbi:hypothetical protein [Rhodoglobus sp.]
MTFTRRIVNALAAVALLAPVLGGCTVDGGAESDLRIEGFSESQQRDFLHSLAQIRTIPGVGEVSWVATPDSLWESYATIEVGVSEAFAADRLGTVAAMLNQFDGNGNGPGLPVSFSIRLPGDDDGGFTVSGLGLPRDTVVENYRYWREITAAMELDVRMDLQVTNLGDVGYLRVLSAPSNMHPLQLLHHLSDNYDALAALSPVEGNPGDALSRAGRQSFELWSFPGLQSSGSLPPREVVDLSEGISRFFPLLINAWLPSNSSGDTSDFEGGGVRWSDDETALQGRGVEIISSEYREEDWPAIVAAAALTSQLAGMDFRYFSFDREFYFHTSTCEGTVQKTDDDQALFDAVQASGVTLLDGAAAGQCIPDF